MREPTRVSADDVRRAAERRKRRQARERWSRLAMLAAVILVVDQAIKENVRATMDPGESIRLIPGLKLTRVTNEGIAFGLFPGRQTVVAVLTVIALAAIALALSGLVKRNMTAAIGCGLLVGGSLGNLFDRLAHGGVTDYIDFVYWPAFNIADIGITVGAVLIVVGLLRHADEEDRANVA